MAKMIELQNGRLKPVRNRLRGNVGHSGKRSSSYDNDIEVRKLRRMTERALSLQVEECELIGPAGRLLRPVEQRPAKSSLKQSSMVVEPSVLGRSEMVSSATVSVKKRPTIKVFIDDDGIMRARPVELSSPVNLLGSPHGYVGYHQGGLLSQALHPGPHALILLDECEPSLAA